MVLISAFLRREARKLDSGGQYWLDKVAQEYGLTIACDDYIITRQIYNILSKMPPDLVKSCGIRRIQLRKDMGPNRTYYPNHGYFIPGTDLVALNADIFYHPDLPDDFMDHRGYFISRPEQTFIHELAHGYDQYNGDLSLKNDWLKLSKWSETPQPGLKRMVIKEPGVPRRIGEWYYNPDAGFTRFYAKMNPWDDWADTFAFYVGGLKTKIPANKTEYFSNLLSKYYS